MKFLDARNFQKHQKVRHEFDLLKKLFEIFFFQIHPSMIYHFFCARQMGLSNLELLLDC